MFQRIRTRRLAACTLNALAISLVLMAAWPAYASKPTWTGLEIRNFAQSAAAPSVIYAAADYGVFKSTDRGSIWIPLKLPRLLNDAAVITHPEQAARVFVLTRSRTGGYYESIDAGKTWAWRVVRSLIMERNATPIPLRSLWIDPTGFGGAWWANLNGELLRSLDQGQTWAYNAAASSRILHQGAATYRLAGDVFFASSNRGATWSEVHRFEPGNFRERLRELHGLADGSLIIQHQGLWRQSTDGGVSWQIASNGLGRVNTTSVPLRSARW